MCLVSLNLSTDTPSPPPRMLQVNHVTCVRMFHHLGTGKGGDSIWGGKFEDEFHETLKVSAYMCSYTCTGMHIASVHLVEMNTHL